jgi:hypothetical protein
MARVEGRTAAALRKKRRSFMLMAFLLQGSGKLSARSSSYSTSFLYQDSDCEALL